MRYRRDKIAGTMQNRREFLSAAGAALAQMLTTKADAAPAGAPGEWRNRQPGVAYRRLGRTGYMVSEVVMGGNTIAPDSYEHVLEALDMGLNYLDTAPAYGRGRSEQGYAKVMRSRPRDRFFLNSKVSLWDINRGKLYQDIYDSLSATEKKKIDAEVQDEIERSGAFAPDYVCDYFEAQRPELPEATRANIMEKRYGRQIDRGKNYRQLVLDSVDESLRRIGTDHLDLLMCPHGASTAYELLNYPEIFEAFETLRKAGKVRHLGVSAHTNPAEILRAAVEARHYSAAMVAYNVVNHRYVDEALEQAAKADLGVIAMKVARPVFSGRRNGKPDDPARVRLADAAVPGPLKVPHKAYIWALRNPRVSAVNSEMVNAQMVRENLPLATAKG
jgi:aryl-alcohol dehydrogenase-like predicted oxidoreductase